MDRDIVNTSIHEWYIIYMENYKTTEEWCPFNGRVLFLLDSEDQEYKFNEVQF